MEALIFKLQEYLNYNLRIIVTAFTWFWDPDHHKIEKEITSGEVEELVNMSDSSGKQRKEKKKTGLLFVQAGVVIWDGNTIADLLYRFWINIIKPIQIANLYNHVSEMCLILRSVSLQLNMRLVHFKNKVPYYEQEIPSCAFFVFSGKSWPLLAHQAITIFLLI